MENNVSSWGFRIVDPNEDTMLMKTTCLRGRVGNDVYCVPIGDWLRGDFHLDPESRSKLSK